MIPAKIYPVTIPASGAMPLQVNGNFFKVLSSSGTLRVIGDTFGDMGQVQPGQGLEQTDFGRLTLVDTSGAANIVQVLIAGSHFIDDRITGEVSVIDGEKARTLSGGYYTACPASVIVAGQYGVVSLDNIGTTRNLVVRQVEGSSGTAGGLYYILTTHAATVAAAFSDVTTAGSGRLANSKAGAPISSNAKVYAGNVAALLPGPLSRSKYVQASGSDVWIPQGGVVIPPGYALAIHANQGTDCNGFFEWFEEPV